MTQNDLIMLVRATLSTLYLAAGTIPCATALAALLVLLAISRHRALRWTYAGLRWLVRGTPLALLALLIYYALAGNGIAVPPVVAGILVLAIYFSILFAEVIRGALLAIPRTATDSALSLGLPRMATLTRVILPMLLRQGLPAYINVCVMAIKGSSVLSIIGVWELTYASREIIERNLEVFQVLSVAAVLYFLICFGADRCGRWAEARLARRGYQTQR
ncbi:ABC transporter permease subunit [Frigidibacter sp. MR17.14]|uniref:ABC transporter permease subunit n=1 Tax=Frigidibacter sp. MR17.14 TaxID=3126509 RepID=UPI003012DAD5